MASERRKARRYLRWLRYQERCDRLVEEQRRHRIGHPMRATPGFFRAEGWDTDRFDLRHGC